MAYILDAAVILILILSIWHGRKKGSVHTIIMLVGCVAALFLAGRLSTPVAEKVYDAFVAPRVEQSLVEKVQAAGTDSVTVDLAALTGGGTLSNYLKAAGLPETVSVGFPDLSEEGIRDTLAPTIETYVRPPVTGLLTAATAILLFLVLFLLAFLLAKAADVIFKLPVLKQLNRATGAIIGALQGVVWVLVFVAVVRLLADWQLFGTVLTPDTVKDTYILSRISTLRIL